MPMLSGINSLSQSTTYSLSPKDIPPITLDSHRKKKTACDELLTEGRALVRNKDDTVAGFNIGMNCGKAAGQTIFHCHIHLIPRREGDVSEPRGGIRHTIPGKGNY